MNTSARSASTLLTRFQKELHRFLQEEKRNTWIDVSNYETKEYIHVYVRNAYRLDPRQLEPSKVIRTLDLASVVIDLRSRGKGNFASIMSCIYAELADYNNSAGGNKYKYQAVFVESIVNTHLYQHIMREYQALNWGVDSLYIYL